MRHFLFILFLSISIPQVQAQSTATPPLQSRHFNLEKSLAIEGYDPVAYFTKGKAIEGRKQFQVNRDGIVYYFSSQANKNLFTENPGKYMPMYGGWCAYAMGDSGEKVEVDPETFKIVDGKLYLFYNSFFNNTLNSWNKDEARLKNRADVSWNRILNK